MLAHISDIEKQMMNEIQLYMGCAVSEGDTFQTEHNAASVGEGMSVN